MVTEAGCQDHERLVCSCGIVVAQCHCLMPKKDVMRPNICLRCRMSGAPEIIRGVQPQEANMTFLDWLDTQRGRMDQVGWLILWIDNIKQSPWGSQLELESKQDDNGMSEAQLKELAGKLHPDFGLAMAAAYGEWKLQAQVPERPDYVGGSPYLGDD